MDPWHGMSGGAAYGRRGRYTSFAPNQNSRRGDNRNFGGGRFNGGRGNSQYGWTNSGDREGNFNSHTGTFVNASEDLNARWGGSGQGSKNVGDRNESHMSGRGRFGYSGGRFGNSRGRFGNPRGHFGCARGDFGSGRGVFRNDRGIVENGNGIVENGSRDLGDQMRYLGSGNGNLGYGYQNSATESGRAVKLEPGEGTNVPPVRPDYSDQNFAAERGKRVRLEPGQGMNVPSIWPDYSHQNFAAERGRRVRLEPGQGMNVLSVPVGASEAHEGFGEELDLKFDLPPPRTAFVSEEELNANPVLNRLLLERDPEPALVEIHDSEEEYDTLSEEEGESEEARERRKRQQPAKWKFFITPTLRLTVSKRRNFYLRMPASGGQTLCIWCRNKFPTSQEEEHRMSVGHLLHAHKGIMARCNHHVRKVRDAWEQLCKEYEEQHIVRVRTDDDPEAIMIACNFSPCARRSGLLRSVPAYRFLMGLEVTIAIREPNDAIGSAFTCFLCQGTFTNQEEFVQHLESEHHREEYMKKYQNDLRSVLFRKDVGKPEFYRKLACAFQRTQGRFELWETTVNEYTQHGTDIQHVCLSVRTHYKHCYRVISKEVFHHSCFFNCDLSPNVVKEENGLEITRDTSKKNRRPELTRPSCSIDDADLAPSSSCLLGEFTPSNDAKLKESPVDCFENEEPHPPIQMDFEGCKGFVGSRLSAGITSAPYLERRIGRIDEINLAAMDTRFNHRDPRRVSRGQLGQPSSTAAGSDPGLSNIQLRSTPGPSGAQAVPGNEQRQHAYMPPSGDRGGVEAGCPSGLSDGITTQPLRNFKLDQRRESTETLKDNRDDPLVDNPPSEAFSLDRCLTSDATPGQSADSNGCMAAKSGMSALGFPLDSHSGDRSAFVSGVVKDNDSTDGSSSSDGGSSDSEETSSSDDDDDDDDEPPKKKLNLSEDVKQQAVHLGGPSLQGFPADFVEAGSSCGAEGACGGGNAYATAGELLNDLPLEPRARFLALVNSIIQIGCASYPWKAALLRNMAEEAKVLQRAATQCEVERVAFDLRSREFFEEIKSAVWLAKPEEQQRSSGGLSVGEKMEHLIAEGEQLLVVLAGPLVAVIKPEPGFEL